MRNRTPCIFALMTAAGFFLLAGVTYATTTVTLDQPVHFLTAEGSDVVLDAGTYTIEAAEEWLLMVGNLTMTACGLIKPINKSTQPNLNNPLIKKDSATNADQDSEAEKTEAEKQYETEGIDSTDDDDPE